MLSGYGTKAGGGQGRNGGAGVRPRVKCGSTATDLVRDGELLVWQRTRRTEAPLKIANDSGSGVPRVFVVAS